MRASYTPLIGGHSRSIPQGMILDVWPLVKSLFCLTKQCPNGFFDSEASVPPKLDITFLGGGGVGVGWGSKVCAQKFVLRRVCTRVILGKADQSAGAAGSRLTGIRTADVYACGQLSYRSTIAGTGSTMSPHCFKPSLPLKKPKLCVSVCLPACPTDCLTDCLPD